MTNTTSSSAYWLYLLTVGLTAACGLIVEIVAGRMLAPYLGMSLYTWTAVIAVALAGFSVGNWIGVLIADRSDSDGERSVAWVLMLAAFSTRTANRSAARLEPNSRAGRLLRNC